MKLRIVTLGILFSSGLFSLLLQAEEAPVQQFDNLDLDDYWKKLFPDEPTKPSVEPTKPSGLTHTEQARITSGGSIHYIVGLGMHATPEQIAATYREFKERINVTPRVSDQTKVRMHNQLDQAYNKYLRSIVSEDVIQLAHRINTGKTIFDMLDIPSDTPYDTVAARYESTRALVSQSNHPDTQNLISRLDQALKAYEATVPQQTTPVTPPTEPITELPSTPKELTDQEAQASKPTVVESPATPEQTQVIPAQQEDQPEQPTAPTIE